MLVLLLSFAIVALDQVTKYLVRVHFYPGEGVSIVPGLFNLAFVRNTGAAWGMFGGFNGWLALLSVVILALIVVFRRSFLTGVLIHRIALGLMVGGIIGNLIDRLRLQYVVDFLDFHWKATYHFPAFNVADASICVGVLVYMLSTFILTSHPLKGNGNSAGPQAQDPANADHSTPDSGR